MKRTILAILVIATAASASSATWSLDSCINYAIEHNLTVRSRIIEHTAGEQSLTEAYDRFLPNLSAGASQNWDFGRGLTSQNTYANRNTSMTGFNASLSLPIFQGLSTVRQIDYSRSRITQLLLQIDAAKDDVTLSVIAQYLQALYAAELTDVAREQVQLSRQMLSRQQDLFDAGKVPEADVIQAKAQVARDELSLTTSDNDRIIALIDLARLLELPDVEGFDVMPLDGDTSAPLLDPEQVYTNALANNSSILAARQGINVADRSISLARTGYIPRISFNAGLGSSYYSLSGAENASFSRQIRDNFSKSLGFSLQIPIFDAFSTRNSIRRARIEKTSAQLQLQQQESQLFKDIRQAYYQATAAAKKLQSSEVATEASRASLEAVTYKYEYGKANATEYQQAKTDYIRALSETVQARYELILRNRILLFYNRH
ncbi:MAG: TolC family protein [Lachnoclostridium sp.]|nr:TolC family protein [Lachnoclostridium sp.]